jgi:iron complex transport system substrate-binding protein
MNIGRKAVCCDRDQRVLRAARSQARRVVIGALLGLAGMLPLLVSAQERVISTDAAITGIVSALGAADRLVGVDDTSVLPPDLASLPRLGYHRALSAEGLMSLKPDLLLLSEHAGPESALAPLAAANVTILRLPVALDLPSLMANTRAVAEALHLPDGAELLSSLESQQAQLRASQPPSAPRTVLLRESDGALRVAGRGSAGDALIRLIGARNAVDYPGYRSFSTEGLLALNPELLLVTTADDVTPADWLNRYPLLRHSRAAQARRVLMVDSAALVGGLGLSALDAAQALQQALQTSSAELGP